MKYWAEKKNSADKLSRRSDFQNSDQNMICDTISLNRIFSENIIKIIYNQALLKTAALIYLQIKKDANKDSNSSERIQNLKFYILLSEKSWYKYKQNNLSLQNMKKILNKD